MSAELPDLPYEVWKVLDFASQLAEAVDEWLGPEKDETIEWEDPWPPPVGASQCPALSWPHVFDNDGPCWCGVGQPVGADPFAGLSKPTLGGWND